MCNLTPEVRDILKILWKRGEISLLFHNIFYLLLDLHVQAGTRFSLRDKRLFEISEFEIARVNCIYSIISYSENIRFHLFISNNKSCNCFFPELP